MININEIKEMIKLVEESPSIDRLEHETTRIVIMKNGSVAAKSARKEPDTDNEDRSDKQWATEQQEVKPAVIHQEAAHPKNELQKIVAPMVGIFYSAPQQGAEPFVKVGQTVTSSTVVCLLEAMKLFHEIQAEIDGEIVEILVKDGEFVEFGQPLFLVRRGE